MRLAELIHRAIPYPVVLVLESQGVVSLSLAHPFGAKQKREKTVLDGDLLMASFDAPARISTLFLPLLP